MIRISTTAIEQLRRVLETEYAAEQELIDSVRGKFEPSEIMRAGSAWDKLLCSPRSKMCQAKSERGNVYWLESTAREAAADAGLHSSDPVEAFVCDECCCWHIGKPTVLRMDGFSFSDHAVSAGKAALGKGIPQVKATKNYQTSQGPAMVVAQADHVHGKIITDIKAKFSNPDARDYESGLQWRFYLDVHQAACFRYMLFDFKDPKGGYCELKDILSFRFWPYADLEDDCQSWVETFVQWASERGLMRHFDREGSGMAVPC